MITTTYRCDRCGHEELANAEMWNVSLRVETGKFKGISADWCKKCMDEKGLIPYATVTPGAAAGQTTSERIEDLLREIVREEIEAAS